MKKTIYILFLAFITLALNAKETNNWQLVLGEDPLSQQTACLLVSATKQTNDGQSTTPVSIIYNGNMFYAMTKSNIDLSYPGTGLKVDYHKPHNIDRLLKNTNVIFETEANLIHNELIKGLSGKLTLGFWPTWPKTRTFVTEFDLRGFTKAYKKFRHCQKTGELP